VLKKAFWVDKYKAVCFSWPYEAASVKNFDAPFFKILVLSLVNGDKILCVCLSQTVFYTVLLE